VITRLVLALAFLIICIAARAADPLASVSIEVKPVGAKKSTRDGFKTDYGSYDKNVDRERSISITAHNFGRAEIPVIVRTWWIGKPAAVGQSRVLLRKEEKELALGKVDQQFVVSSGLVEGRDMNLRIIGHRRVDGHKIEGWIVTVHEPGTDRLVTHKSSDPAYASLLKPQFTLSSLPLVKEDE